MSTQEQQSQEPKPTVDVTTSIIINKPITKVSLYVINPANTPLWNKNIKLAEWKSQSHVVQGSQVAFTAHFMGREISYTYELAAVVPESKLVMRPVDDSYPLTIEYSFEKIDDSSTRVTLRNYGSPTGFIYILTPLTELVLRRANNADLKLLKQLLEKAA